MRGAVRSTVRSRPSCRWPKIPGRSIGPSIATSRGGSSRPESFKAVVTVNIEPTRSLSQVLQNPLGIYVVDFHVTEVG